MTVPVSVVIPWRATPDRQAAHDWTVRWWRTTLPDARIIHADTDPDSPFNLSAARNDGVRQAAAGVVVVTDADTVPEPGPLADAIAAAAVGGVHWPYDRAVYLDAAETDRLLDGHTVQPSGWKGEASGGTVVTTPAVWWRIGGMDERFRVWGGEDDAFKAAARRLVPTRNHPGLITVLHHDGGHRYPTGWDAQSALVRAYKTATDRELRFLVAEGRAMTTRYLILAAGDGSRWDNAKGVPKHLVKVRGERLLDRIVRQVGELDPDADIKVVVSDLADTRYKLAGTSRTVAKHDPALGEIDKLMSSRHQWHRKGRTVILLGDVYYTTAAIARIVAHQTGTWAQFGRPGPSKITGHPWNENFAVVFWPGDHQAMADAAQQTATFEATTGRKGYLSQWWQLMKGLDPAGPFRAGDEFGNWVTIDDATDDFDYLDDWDRWCWRWAHASEADRAQHWR